MEVIIFLVVLVVLIVVHELGHFFVAKWSGMRVDEFGLGYPPRIATIATVGETKYTLNALPFGGFVKIYGEDGGGDDARAFSARSRVSQAFTLFAGIAMNLVFAYVLIAGALFVGMPRALAPSETARAHDVELAVSGVLPESPAAKAGLAEGDLITRATDASGSWQASSPVTFSDFITGSKGSPVTLSVRDTGNDLKTVTVIPEKGLVPELAGRYAIGVDIATVGVLPLSFGQSIVQGAILSWGVVQVTAVGLVHFFGGVFTLSTNLSQVAGPVGIATVVGSAAQQGFGNLLSIVALISINLALINLIPIPALDGGRLLFLLIESIRRKKISPRIAQTVNTVGFVFLILLMVVVTAHDIFKIVA